MFEWIADPQAWLGLVTLTILEIVLGIDNIIFLSLIVAKLPKQQQNRARRLGLLAAMLMRLGLLASIAWIVKLDEPLFSILNHPISAKDLILFFGGLFLLWKSVVEILESVNCTSKNIKCSNTSFLNAIVQIMILDIVFSLDSVITAVGLSEHLFIMMTAVIIAVGVMLLAAKPIGNFVERHPSVKMLALAFLILIGITLIAESAHIHIAKGYIYFAIFFSMAVEALNLWQRKKR